MLVTSVILLALAISTNEWPPPVVAIAQVQSSGPLSSPASSLNPTLAALLTPIQRREILAVEAASSPDDRARLVVSLTPPGAHEKRTLVLFYGDPRNPSGLDPAENSTEWYHVIGESCNDFYQASTGQFTTSPGDTGECATGKPSPADVAAQRFKRLCGSPSELAAVTAASLALPQTSGLDMSHVMAAIATGGYARVVIETKGEFVAYFKHQYGAWRPIAASAVKTRFPSDFSTCPNPSFVNHPTGP